jgi:hypothetical protein
MFSDFRTTALATVATGLALAAMTIALRPSVVQADEHSPFKGTRTVQFTGSQQCAPGDATCSQCVQNSGFFIEAQGIGDTSLGPLFAKVLKCFYPDKPPYGTYVGTLSTTAPNGSDSLTWEYSGQNDNGGDFYGFGPFSGKLTVKGGAGKFKGARGDATFTAASGPSIPASGYRATAPSSFNIQGTAFYYILGTINQGAQ